MKFPRAAAPRLLRGGLFLGVLLLGACAATKPMPPNLASQGHLYYEKPARGVPATAVFVRDFGFAGLGKTVYLYIDGDHAGDLETSEKVEIELSAGYHIFGIEIASATGQPPTGQTTSTADGSFEPGETYFYRIASDPNGTRIERAK